MDKFTQTGRRQLAGRAAAFAGLAATPLLQASPAFAQALKILMGIGLTNDGAPHVFAMQRDKLLEKAAEELGFKLDTEYLNFPVLLRMLQGLAAGQLDIGMLGSTPTIRNLAQPNPAVPIMLAGGGIKFPLQVPPGSPIKNLDHLKGKTILTIVGSDLHLVLNLMLRAHFGTDDPKELGITVKNIQAFAELSRWQSGIDAVLNVEPVGAGAVSSGQAVNLLLNDGTTGPAYEGPEGKGAGLKIASFAKTPFNAEAYYPHRIWWVAREEFLAKNPKAVVALMMAIHRATQITNKMTPDQVIDLASQDWFSDRAAQRPYVENILYRRRGWSWITEGDARTLVGLSQVKSIYQTALTGAGVTRTLKLSAPLAKDAWERVAKEPGPEAFAKTDAGDLRGKPHWEIDSWSL
ncbi:MAG: ABC transporter substrate-binding protein [Alphaproteobacteria bacterium]|nr:ABC transporter substrate-binding protein [Alphaproteobacteria bacterium]